MKNSSPRCWINPIVWIFASGIILALLFGYIPAQKVYADGPTLSIDDVSLTEGDSSTASMIFTVTLTGTPTQTVTVDYDTVAGTATAPSDYTSTTDTLTFTPPDVSQTISVPIVGDLVHEPTETFSVHLSSPTNATIAKSDGTGTINDNDGLPTLSINNTSLTEGNSGTSPMIFTVTLAGATGQTVTVAFATVDNTATAGSDYTSTSGTLTFIPPNVSQTISVPIVGDLVDEPTETFSVHLSSPTNATIAKSDGIGTINDNDPPPSLSINNASLTEGDSSTSLMNFTVTLAGATGQTVTVAFATVDNTATAGSDYTSTSGTLTFTPPNVSQTISVPIVGDLVDEPTETFSVHLSSPTNATIAKSDGIGTIYDNDPSPSLSINNTSVIEGDSATSPMIFTVTLAGATGQTVTVAYATVDNTATAGSDYTSTSGTLTFTPPNVSQTISVPIVGDLVDEPTETFSVHLSSPTNATIAKSDGIGTIYDNDPSPSLSINNTSVIEGDSATSPMIFTVTLAGATGQTVTVAYTTVDNTATAGSDYTSTSGTLTFIPPTVSQTISVPIVGDLVHEPTETFSVHLSSPTNATIAKSDGTGTINDNDGLPTLSINNTSLTEGNSGTSPMIFTVTLAGATGQTVTVAYTTVDNTATAGSDYTSTSGTLTFIPPNVSQTISVPIIGDLAHEPTETFSVHLSSPTNATIAKSDGIGTIYDNDGLPTLSVNDASLTEGDSGTSLLNFTVTLAGATGQTVTVAYATVDNTATAPSDYTSTSGTLTFTPPTVSQTISVPIIGDLVDEPTETFWVRLSSPTNATVVKSQGTGAINDNDPPPAIAFSQNNPYTVVENDVSGHAVIPVNLSAASAFPVSVNYATSDGTAHQGINYQTTSGTLTFPAGTTSQSIIVPVLNDHQNNPNLYLTIALTGPVNAALGDPPSATLWIIDQDAPPMISINNVSQNEGNGGMTNFTFTVTLSAKSGNFVTVDYATSDGTATAGSDYISNSGSLTFKPGDMTKTISVLGIGDDFKEPDENFNILLSNPFNGAIVVNTGIGTILDDDLFRTMLPILFTPGQPDLIVEAFTLTPSRTTYRVGQAVLVTVQVKNNGSAYAGPFWVDFYINPQPPPSDSNIPWNTVCGMNPCYGIAWYVNDGLNAGQTITLTSTADSYDSGYTIWSGSFPFGTTELYTYVDSWGGNNPSGAVEENNETNNRGEIHGLMVTQ